jgi:hypothetical protein
MLDKLVDRLPVSLSIDDTSLTHVMRLAAHSTTNYRVTINDCPIAVGAENHTNVGCVVNLAT